MSLQMFEMMTDEELVKHFVPETEREAMLLKRIEELILDAESEFYFDACED